jgi:hypothetical protein
LFFARTVAFFNADKTAFFWSTAIFRLWLTLSSRMRIEALRRPGDRMVLGPADDGGYYLIGLKRACRHVFTDIPWGTAEVTRLTLSRAADIGLEVTLLPAWYDVDDGETLELLRDELVGHSRQFKGGGAASATREFLGIMPR